MDFVYRLGAGFGGPVTMSPKGKVVASHSAQLQDCHRRPPNVRVWARRPGSTRDIWEGLVTGVARAVSD